ncbi:hypothetical protein WG66_012406 [Moniliophthora roreri]|nr:hypothetical protein WG66_012406 [Moniliophthora roreri]
MTPNLKPKTRTRKMPISLLIFGPACFPIFYIWLEVQVTKNEQKFKEVKSSSRSERHNLTKVTLHRTHDSRSYVSLLTTKTIQLIWYKELDGKSIDCCRRVASMHYNEHCILSVHLSQIPCFAGGPFSRPLRRPITLYSQYSNQF